MTRINEIQTIYLTVDNQNELLEKVEHPRLKRMCSEEDDVLVVVIDSDKSCIDVPPKEQAMPYQSDLSWKITLL